jgi:prolyl-tRNA synthetase
LAKRTDDEVGQEAQELYEALLDAALEVLFDDRKESPGVKFADADLIGVPWRVTISARSLKQGGVEVKRRSEPEKKIMPLDDVVDFLLDEVWG